MAREAVIVFSLSLVALFFTGQPAVAHSMAFGGQILGTICIAANSQFGWTVFNNAGPFDKTWFIRARIGLDGGDTGQNVRWDLSLIDAGISAEVSNWREATFDWVTTGTWVFADTVSGHIGGGVTMIWTIYNTDGFSQCFMVFVRSAYM